MWLHRYKAMSSTYWDSAEKAPTVSKKVFAGVGREGGQWVRGVPGGGLGAGTG